MVGFQIYEDVAQAPHAADARAASRGASRLGRGGAGAENCAPSSKGSPRCAAAAAASGSQ